MIAFNHWLKTEGNIVCLRIGKVREQKSNPHRRKHRLYFLLSCWRQNLECFRTNYNSQTQFPEVKVRQQALGTPAERGPAGLAKLQTQALPFWELVEAVVSVPSMITKGQLNVGDLMERFPVGVVSISEILDFGMSVLFSAYFSKSYTMLTC